MKKLTKQDEKDFDQLAELLKGTSPERLRTLLVKTKHLNLKVTESDKEDIRRTASALRLTMTEYLLRLHYWTADRLKQKKA